MRHDNPSKQPFEIVAVRVSMDGQVIRMIEDKDEGVFWVGCDLTLENLNQGGPYGCRTCYCKDDAYSEMEGMI